MYLIRVDTGEIAHSLLAICECIGSLSIRDSISRTMEVPSILPTQGSSGFYDLGSAESVRALLTHSDNDPIQS